MSMSGMKFCRPCTATPISIPSFSSASRRLASSSVEPTMGLMPGMIFTVPGTLPNFAARAFRS